MDGEAAGVDPASLQQHLDRCPDCVRWRDAATRLDRRVRIGPAAGPQPDVAERVLAQVRLPRRLGWRGPLRVAVLVVALVQLGIGAANMVLPLGFHGGMPMSAHMSHEVAAFNLAFGVALMMIAVRPVRARAHVPVLGVFLVVIASASVFDLLDGAVSWTRLATHAPILVGLLLATALARTARPPTTPGGDTGLTDRSETVPAATDPDADAELPGRHAGPRRGTPPPAARHGRHRHSA